MSASHPNHSWPDSVPLDTVLKAGALVSGGSSTENRSSHPSGLPDVLHNRLKNFDATVDGIDRDRSMDVASLQLDTAFASLYVLERVHILLLQHEVRHSQDSSVPPLIGTKDMAQIRTHISIVFNWGVDQLFVRILPTLNKKPTRSPRVPADAHIIDLTATSEDYAHVFDIVSRLLVVVLPEGPQGPSATTFVAMTVLSRGFSDLLRACICLGWLPSGIRNDFPSALDFKSYVSRLLNGSQPAQSITALGSIMRKHIGKPWYIHKVCRMLSIEQLLRPAGVAGLFSSVFGEDISSTEAPLEKLQSTSDVLNTLPPNLSREEYYPMMIPRLLHLLSPSMDKVTPPSHRRAAAFALSRMLSSKDGSGEDVSTDIRRSVVEWCLLDSFKPVSRPDPVDNTQPETAQDKARSIAKNALILPPSQVVSTLSTILMNTDSSPELIDVLLQPIAPQLYTFSEYLRVSPTADPMVRETVEGLLGIWVRVAERTQLVDALFEVADGHGGHWDIDDEGELRIYERSSSLPSLTLAQLADLQEGRLDMEENDKANVLNLSPDPLHFAKFLKETINRDDVVSALYLRILDAHVKMDKDGDPLRKFLLFKLSMQISAQVGADAEADSPLRRPDVTRMLMFIKMSLDREDVMRDSKSAEGNLTMESLRIVPEDETEEEDEDSDDEDLAPGLEGVSKREHLSVTAVNLLLALLEENPDLSAKSVPLLNEIYTQLEPLANSQSEALRPRAREARITLTARLASSNVLPENKRTQKEVGEESPQEKYQRALKLLQDPLLPVRAHGLLLLRELVAPVKTVGGKKREKDSADASTGTTVSVVQGAAVAIPAIDEAYVSAILSIFMQSIQDEDSYMFLNAVQGLAAMVDGFGREVLRGLVDEYAKGLKGIGGPQVAMTIQDVDLRLRIGEALGQIIKRCGGALGKYVDIIVPRLFAVIRASHLPTTLRTSAVSLLATTANTNAIALNAYTADLISAMVDLIQVESMRTEPKTATGSYSPAPEITGQEADSSKAEGTEMGRPGDVNDGPKSRAELRPAQGTASRTASDQPKMTKAREEIENMMDTQPTAANAKFPPLRRAALHFLSLLLRALTARVYEGEHMGGVPGGPEMKRTASVLGYVSMSDEDGVVRVMAREAAEQLQQLQNALLGL